MYAILLTVGLGAIWLSFHPWDEIYRLGWIVVSFFTLLWGYLISPLSIQMLILIFILGDYLIFSLKNKRF